jgi:predicted nucleotidyltransferase
MPPSFSTENLDRIISDRRLKNESDRQQLLIQLQAWLDQNGERYGIDRAYIFGSVTRPHRFHQNSDIDLAIENINPEDFCLVISLLYEYLAREVDVIQLRYCHFANRIRQTGILWTAIV